MIIYEETKKQWDKNFKMRKEGRQMSRKALFDKETIIKASFLIFERRGIDSFKVRNIAKVLNSSTSPIYYQFKSIEEIENAMVSEIVGLFLRPVKHLPDYYTYENLTIAYCLFARNHRKLFEAIFLKSNHNSENSIREKLLKTLKAVIEQDQNFDYDRDYHKLLCGDGLALKIFNSGRSLEEVEVRKLVDKYLTAQKEKNL